MKILKILIAIILGSLIGMLIGEFIGNHFVYTYKERAKHNFEMGYLECLDYIPIKDWPDNIFIKKDSIINSKFH